MKIAALVLILSLSYGKSFKILLFYYIQAVSNNKLHESVSRSVPKGTDSIP